MGDRGNIIVRDNGEQVCLYTHWRGSELKKDLKLALSKRERWGDSQYLSRIIFCQMLNGDTKGTTGFGISQSIGDGENNVFYVDVDSQTVTYRGVTKGFIDFIED